MQGIAEFHKVSLSQFKKDSIKCGFLTEDMDEEITRGVWETIKLPARATGGSAGYDFYLPYPFSLTPGRQITIPTGIRADIQPGWFLQLVPRSGLGFKFGLKLVNTLGIIDADYYYAENEGHIMAKISVESPMCLEDSDRFIQGIFLPHGVTRSDVTLGIHRTGGMGSTGGA